MQLCDKLQFFSLRPIERAVESRPHRANVGAAPRPDEVPDSCLLNVDSNFDCPMQTEGRKDLVVDSVVFASNAINGPEPPCLHIRHVACPSEGKVLTKHRAMLPLGAGASKLHVPASSRGRR